jgi:hypothetical protein
VDISSEEQCEREIFVEIEIKGGKIEDRISVPLINIKPIDADERSRQAIGDWHYWWEQ